MQACDRCHVRKTRCDRRIPQCGSCEKAGAPCLHADKLRQRNIPRGYLDSMEILVQQLNEENRKLRSSLAATALNQTPAPAPAPAPAFAPALAPASPLHQHRQHVSAQEDQYQQQPGPDQEGRDPQHPSHHQSVPPLLPPSSASLSPLPLHAPSAASPARETNNAEDGIRPRSSLPATDSPPAQTCVSGISGGAESQFSSTTPGSSSTQTHHDEYAFEVGYLSLVAIGETRYLGSSSGMGLANMISTVIGAQSGMPFLSMEDPDSHVVTPSLPTDVMFPSRETAMPFIDAYFQHTHITFPLLHRPTFMATLDRIYGEPGYYQANAFDAFTFDMVLAIGSSNFNLFDESAVVSSKYFAMAQNKVRAVMSVDGLTSLKGILLISHHGIFSNLRDTSASIWHLVGIGARICFELGLHLEQRDLSSRPVAGKRSPKTISWEEEMRKRCFWCLYNLDRVVSFTLGRPVAIRDEEIDVSLPSYLDDDLFGPDRPIVLDTPGDTSEKISPFLHLIHIRRLSGQILTMFYNSRVRSTTALEKKRLVRCRFREKIEAWKEDTRRLGLSESHDGFRSSFLSPEWYDAVYNNAILLLYRPSPYMPNPAMVADKANGDPDVIRLLKAATTSIESYRLLHCRRRLNYSWITLHGVFISGICYIYCIGRILRDPGSHGLVPDLLQLIDTTRACSTVLVAICERWNVSRRSCELFNRLTNAVIRDMLNVTGGKSSGEGAGSGRASHVGTSQDTQMSGGGSSDVTGQCSSGQHLSQTAPHQVPHQTVDEQQSCSVSSSSSSALDVGLLGSIPQLDDILVMDEFRQYAGSFDISNQTGTPFPSELVSSFSQDWPFDVPLSTPGDLDSAMDGVTTIW